MQKRGQAEIWETLSLFEVLAGISVAVFMIIAALGYNSVTPFGKTYLKLDLQMMSGAISSSPANMVFQYPVDAGYHVSLTNPVSIESESSLGFGKYNNLTLNSDNFYGEGQ